MRIGLVEDDRSTFFIKRPLYEEILNHNGIDFRNVPSGQVDIDDLRDLDVLIYRFGGYDHELQIAGSVLPVAEQLGIRCFPDYRTGWHYDNKISEYFLLKSFGFPVVNTWVFFDEQSARRWLGQAKFPLVFKLYGGASSHNVLKVGDKKRADQLVADMFGRGISATHAFVAFEKSWTDKGLNLLRLLYYRASGRNPIRFSNNWKPHKDYVLFQEFLPGNDFDIRVTVIGDRAFAFRRFNRPGDFRASGSGLIDYDVERVDLEAVKIAFDVSKRLGFQSMAYDFLYDTGENLKICEISYTYMSKAIHDCPGYWDNEMNWHEGHYWPEYFHLVDLLGDESLRQPSIQCGD